jgi:hypothetical protein
MQIPKGNVGGAYGGGLWLPLGPGLAVRPFTLSVPEQLVSLDDAAVEAINDQIMVQSELVASGSPEHFLTVSSRAGTARTAPAGDAAGIG